MRRNSSAGLLLALACGCDLPELRYETEHLRIGTDFDGPICGGSLLELERQVLLVEDSLGFEVDHKLELYIFENGPGKLCDYDEAGGGCYDVSAKRAYASFGAARHEIIHAAAHQLGQPDALFGEGLAVDLTGLGLRFGTSYPSSSLGLKPPDVSFRTAGHFVRWLRLTYTQNQMRDILAKSSPLRGPDHAKKAFRRATGDSFAEAQQAYFETAPEFYAAFDVLPPPFEEANVGDGWDLVFDLDCDRDDTEGYLDKMWRSVLVDIIEPGPYVLQVTPPARAVVTLRRTEDWPAHLELPQAPPPPVGDDWLEYGQEILGGIPTDLMLEVGTYRIEVRVASIDLTSVRLWLYPKIGTLPVPP